MAIWRATPSPLGTRALGCTPPSFFPFTGYGYAFRPGFISEAWMEKLARPTSQYPAQTTTPRRCLRPRPRPCCCRPCPLPPHPSTLAEPPATLPAKPTPRLEKCGLLVVGTEPSLSVLMPPKRPTLQRLSEALVLPQLMGTHNNDQVAILQKCHDNILLGTSYMVPLGSPPPRRRHGDYPQIVRWSPQPPGGTVNPPKKTMPKDPNLTIPLQLLFISYTCRSSVRLL